MKFKKGNIVKVNDKLGVVIDTEYMNQKYYTSSDI